MDWLIPLLFVIVSIALSGSSNKKKKQEAEAKRARQAAQKQSAQTEEYRQKPKPRAGHPYAESAKDKGMTLDDFRRRYENASGSQRPQPAKPMAAKPAPAKMQMPRPTVAEPQAEQPARQTQPKTRQPKQPPKQHPQRQKSVPVTGVDIGSQAKESPVMAGVMVKKNNLHTEFGADAVAFVQSKKLSPMQQGLLWAEILGPPKAKRQGGRY